MKAVGVISTTVLFLLLGYAVPAFAQDEHHEDAKPEPGLRRCRTSRWFLPLRRSDESQVW